MPRKHQLVLTWQANLQHHAQKRAHALEPINIHSSSDSDNPQTDHVEATSDCDSILSVETHLSEDDIPFLNNMDGYAEILAAGMRRLKSDTRMHVRDAIEGVSVLYKKLGRKSDSTEWCHRAKIRNALAESEKNGNQLTRWFKPDLTIHPSVKDTHHVPSPMVPAAESTISSHHLSPIAHCPIIQITIGSENEEEEEAILTDLGSSPGGGADTTHT
ncbi:hypothetical protein BS47DRAFT_1382031, partial [Hydnum rufescens UP504]